MAGSLPTIPGGRTAGENMAQDSGETLEVTLTPEDQMVLKYLVKLMMQGVSRDEVALAFDHAFVDVRETEVAALRSAASGR